MNKSEDLSEDITGYRSINHKIMFSDLPPDNSVYGSGNKCCVYDISLGENICAQKHLYNDYEKSIKDNIINKNINYYSTHTVKFKPDEYDKYIIKQPIFFLNKKIDDQLIKQIALEAHIQERGKEYNSIKCIPQFENYIYTTKSQGSTKFSFNGDSMTSSQVHVIGIGPNIITRVKFLVNVFNSRLQHKEDEQHTEQSKQQQLIHNITSIITQQFQEKMNIQSMQLKEVVERIQVLEQVVFRKTNDIKHDLRDLHHHIADIGEEILEKVDSNI